MMEWNVNEFVYVKLTDWGREIHYKDHLDFLASLPPKVAAEYHAYTMPPVDENGWCKFQGWQLMRIFGAHMQLGGPNPFELSVRFEDKTLRSVSDTTGEPK